MTSRVVYKNLKGFLYKQQLSEYSLLMIIFVMYSDLVFLMKIIAYAEREKKLVNHVKVFSHVITFIKHSFLSHFTDLHSRIIFR